MWAAIFPGQGSQSVGMGRFLFENFKSSRDLFTEASDTLSLDFKKLCFDGPESDLNLTENTQPALLLVSTATSVAVKEVTGIEFKLLAGHSIGEYAAFVAADSIRFTDAIRAVRKRGQAMQAAVPVGQGSMCAVIGLSDDQVRNLCNWASRESGLGVVEPANFNAPGQVVVSGHAAVIDWMRTHAKSELFAPDAPKIRLIPLQVSAPFHCSLMAPAENEMREVLNRIEIRSPNASIVQNFSARDTSDVHQLRENLIRQVTGSVRWVECAKRLSELGVTKLVECGHGKVLAGLAKKIEGALAAVYNVQSLDDLRALEVVAKSN